MVDPAVPGRALVGGAAPRITGPDEPRARASAAERLLPRAGGAGARALARARHLQGDAAQPRGSAAVRVLRGTADRERLPRLPPRAGTRLQGRVPALQDDDRALRRAQG